jgi:hypothetical protein
MSNKPQLPPIFKTKSLGIIIFTAAQLFIGAIHLIIGLLLLVTPVPIMQSTITYDIYTVVFGLLVMVFAYFVWQGKKAGWIGTMAVLFFVAIADSLVVLNLPSVPGIPRFAAPTEIAYSVIVVAYLMLPKVRKKFLNRDISSQGSLSAK